MATLNSKVESKKAYPKMIKSNNKKKRELFTSNIDDFTTNYFVVNAFVGGVGVVLSKIMKAVDGFMV